ncbi:hypothetical protein CROQUDRAFT_665350 [Cronartium quercuum f. sp. fusiforme G11]|uniref:Uncharacterized protein n=1 Tax=Cronartium quercuum f. sp. fusiforme G11 TaxID=708437 RepID=A0A9P6T5V6_9BASI|nr:hypothetical protein CROQUDRAFT_665350 [Cronartium quercuum f. sp. fusiforme G11]
MFSTSVYLSLVLAFFVAQSLSVKMTKVVRDLGPIVPSEQAYLSKHYNLTKQGKIYDSNGQMTWTLDPGLGMGRVVVLTKVGTMNFTMITLAKCPKPAAPNFFLDVTNHVWKVETTETQPGVDDFTFNWRNRSMVLGDIQYHADQNLAFLDEEQLKAKGSLTAGQYYAVNIPRVGGPYLQDEEDALTLLILLLDQLTPCKK